MAETFRIRLTQANPVLGAIAANAERAFAEWQAGAAEGVDLVTLSEMFLTGYQTQDLVLKAAFLEATGAALLGLAALVHQQLDVDRVIALWIGHITERGANGADDLDKLLVLGSL